jgi:hypothetical protein
MMQITYPVYIQRFSKDVRSGEQKTLPTERADDEARSQVNQTPVKRRPLCQYK